MPYAFEGLKVCFVVKKENNEIAAKLITCYSLPAKPELLPSLLDSLFGPQDTLGWTFLLEENSQPFYDFSSPAVLDILSEGSALIFQKVYKLHLFNKQSW